MDDAVYVCGNYHTYSLAAIQDWSKRDNTCPACRDPLLAVFNTNRDVIENVALYREALKQEQESLKGRVQANPPSSITELDALAVIAKEAAVVPNSAPSAATVSQEPVAVVKALAPSSDLAPTDESSSTTLDALKSSRGPSSAVSSAPLLKSVAKAPSYSLFDAAKPSEAVAVRKVDRGNNAQRVIFHCTISPDAVPEVDMLEIDGRKINAADKAKTAIQQVLARSIPKIRAHNAPQINVLMAVKQFTVEFDMPKDERKLSVQILNETGIDIVLPLTKPTLDRLDIKLLRQLGSEARLADEETVSSTHSFDALEAVSTAQIKGGSEARLADGETASSTQSYDALETVNTAQM